VIVAAGISELDFGRLDGPDCALPRTDRDDGT
jgi:hypothetical protein